MRSYGTGDLLLLRMQRVMTSAQDRMATLNRR